MNKEDLFYSDKGIWISNEGYLGVVQKHIDDLGDIVFVNLPMKGDILTKDSLLFSLESSKSNIDFVSPVNGLVLLVNEDIFNNPELLNKNSFDNWVIKVDVESFDELMSYNDIKSVYEV